MRALQGNVMQFVLLSLNSRLQFLTHSLTLQMAALICVKTLLVFLLLIYKLIAKIQHLLAIWWFQKDTLATFPNNTEIKMVPETTKENTVFNNTRITILPELYSLLGSFVSKTSKHALIQSLSDYWLKHNKYNFYFMNGLRLF